MDRSGQVGIHSDEASGPLGFLRIPDAHFAVWYWISREKSGGGNKFSIFPQNHLKVLQSHHKRQKMRMFGLRYKTHRSYFFLPCKCQEKRTTASRLQRARGYSRLRAPVQTRGDSNSATRLLIRTSKGRRLGGARYFYKKWQDGFSARKGADFSYLGQNV